MDLSGLHSLLKEIGIPVANWAFEDSDWPEPPYILFYESGSSVFHADNTAYFINPIVVVELYTSRKCPELEMEVESALRSLESGMSKEETFWETESLHRVTYKVSL